jgi:hypothetical protein
MDNIAVLILMGLLPALITQAKGRSFGLWWVYGMLLFPIALPHSAIIKTYQAEQLKKNLTA